MLSDIVAFSSAGASADLHRLLPDGRVGLHRLLLGGRGRRVFRQLQRRLGQRIIHIVVVKERAPSSADWNVRTSSVAMGRRSVASTQPNAWVFSSCKDDLQSVETAVAAALHGQNHAILRQRRRRIRQQRAVLGLQRRIAQQLRIAEGEGRRLRRISV